MQGAVEEPNVDQEDPLGTENKKELSRSSFKRRHRKGEGSKTNMNVRVGKKRELEDMEIDEEDKIAKKSKVAVVLNNELLAGLSEQPCKEQ
jgi:hypothetical protein